MVSIALIILNHSIPPRFTVMILIQTLQLVSNMSGDFTPRRSGRQRVPMVDGLIFQRRNERTEEQIIQGQEGTQKA